MNRSRRRLLQQLTALGLLSGAGIPGLIRNALAAGNYPVMQGMHKIRGEVRINGKFAREGQPVLPGDKVTTGVDSEAIYVIDGNAFLQRGNSMVQFGKEAAKEFPRRQRQDTFGVRAGRETPGGACRRRRHPRHRLLY